MTNALDIYNLSKIYPPSIHAVCGIDLHVKKGDFFALLGPNGAGKSTIIGIISSTVTKTSGQVKINGYDIDKNSHNAKRQVGIVPQEFNFSPFETVQEIIVNQAGYYGVPAEKAITVCAHYLKQLNLWNKQHTISKNLSGGMKRRLMLVRALVHSPSLLILDEPSAGVDIELRRSLWTFMRMLNQQGVTIILTTHYLEEAEQECKNIAIIHKGKIIQNSSMHTFLSQVKKEKVFVQTQHPLNKCPCIPGFHIVQHNPTTLEITIDIHNTLNKLFTHLNASHINVVSIRPKTNRLEELFMHITQDHPTEDHNAL